MPDQKTYWFRAKRYGWGWGMPSAWQGWVVYLIYIGTVLYYIPVTRSLHHIHDTTARFLLLVTVLSAALIFVCWWKGEPAKWRWGSD